MLIHHLSTFGKSTSQAKSSLCSVVMIRMKNHHLLYTKRHE